MKYAGYLVNAACVFLLKLIKYPFSSMVTAIAKRLSWPLLQSYALGLVNSPTSLSEVEIKNKPAGVHLYEELPKEIAAAAVGTRNQAAQAEVARFIEAVSNSDWSVDAVKQCLRKLNQPGLVHSCYYGLDHPWVIDKIVGHIESYQRAAKKAQDDEQKEMNEQLHYYGRD